MNKLYAPTDDVMGLVAMIVEQSEYCYEDLMIYLDLDPNTPSQELNTLLDDEKRSLIHELHQMINEDC